MSKPLASAALAAAVLLASGISFRLLYPPETGKGPAPADGQNEAADAVTRVFAIEGMHCQGCAASVASTLNQIPGVQSALVTWVQSRLA